VQDPKIIVLVDLAAFALRPRIVANVVRRAEDLLALLYIVALEPSHDGETTSAGYRSRWSA
jgi:hypothetical protein